VETSVVIGIEPHRQGQKVATWTWDEGKVTIASVDGVTDEFSLRVGRPEYVAQPGDRRYTNSSQGGWAPWDNPLGGFGDAAPTKRTTVRKKSKSIFDLLFN
jgi:hypothetical protein